MIAAMAAAVNAASILRLLSDLADVSGEATEAEGGAASTLRLLSGLGDVSDAAGGAVTVEAAGTNATGLAEMDGVLVSATGG
jgi:hypothetical protein